MALPLQPPSQQQQQQQQQGTSWLQCSAMRCNMHHWLAANDEGT